MASTAKQGFAHYLAWGTTMPGWARAAPGHDEAGMAQIRRGLAALRAMGAALRLPYYLALLAEALAQAHKARESWTEAELHRLKGELLLALSADNHAEAEGCFH